MVKDASNRWAVLIGINGYHESLGRLKYSINDCRRLADVLTAGDDAFPADQVLVLTDDDDAEHRPTYANIHSWLASWLAQPNENDTVLVFFAGHGREMDGKCYLVPGDATLQTIHVTGIPVPYIQELLHRCKARQKVLILDACHSGAGRDVSTMAAPMMETLSAGTGIYTLTSCDVNELSHEWDEKKQGVFSYYLAEALSGSCPPDAHGRISAEAAYEWVYDKVRRWAVGNRCAQTPRRVAATTGSIFIWPSPRQANRQADAPDSNQLKHDDTPPIDDKNLIRRAAEAAELAHTGQIRQGRHRGRIVVFDALTGVGAIDIRLSDPVFFSRASCSWSQADRDLAIGLVVDFLIEDTPTAMRALNMKPASLAEIQRANTPTTARKQFRPQEKPDEEDPFTSLAGALQRNGLQNLIIRPGAEWFRTTGRKNSRWWQFEPRLKKNIYSCYPVTLTSWRWWIAMFRQRAILRVNILEDRPNFPKGHRSGSRVPMLATLALELDVPGQGVVWRAMWQGVNTLI